MPYTAPPMIPTRQGAIVTTDIGTTAAMPGDPDAFWQVTVTRASVWMSSARDWLARLGLAPLKP